MISLVIPVFNIEKYLTECLDSITQQTFKNLEIIAVDGASKDASGRILDDRSQQEPRLTVIHEERIGPGRARNVGAKRAKGEYLWFVDGDDVILPGCLAVIADRIDATRPDVLFIDHETFYPSGRTEPNPERSLLARKTTECFTIADHPWVIDLSMVSWNKIIRRDFFRSADVAFPQDWPHEDVPVTCSLLLEARRLSILNQVCYRYRPVRYGSAMRTGPPQRHFNIFHAYETVLDQIQKRVSNSDLVMTEDVQRALFSRAIWHYTTILDTGGLGVGPVGINGFIARHDRRDFFARMHWDFLRYVPPGYRPASGVRGIKFRSIERNAYWMYSILPPTNKLHVRLGSIRVGRRRVQDHAH